MTTTEELQKELLTIKEAKAYLKCSHVFLWNIRKTGLIETAHAGKKVLIPKTSIDNYLKLKSATDNVKINITTQVNEVAKLLMENPSLNPFNSIPQETIDNINAAALQMQDFNKQHNKTMKAMQQACKVLVEKGVLNV